MSQQSTSAQAVSRLMQRILLFSAIAGVAIALIAAVIGGLTVGVSGVYSALIGAAVAFVFFGITAAIMLFTADAGPAVTAGAAMGGFLVKVVPVSYTHLTLPTIHVECRSRWSPYH